MDAKQIYSVVNSVVEQATGKKELTVADNQGLVSLGNAILSSQDLTDNFLNTLVMRIGKTIVSYRQYRNTFNSLMMDDFEWGNILQKIKVSMPQAVTDESYGLENGKSVDHYKVSKPVATQKLFTTNAPYAYYITIQRAHLKEAFTSENSMGAFISAIYGEVNNAIELGLENLGRNCLGNYVAEIHGSGREINLLKEYNEKTSATLTSASCLFDNGFLRYAVGRIKNISKKFTSMTQIYNDGTETRHTPLEMQKLFVLSDFETALETQVEYGAFHEQYVSLNGFEEIPFWQSINTPMDLKVSKASDNTETNVKGLVAVLFDHDSMGMFKHEEDVLTTPVNASGMYYNTYWHEKQLWFNDLSENCVTFIIADSDGASTGIEKKSKKA